MPKPFVTLPELYDITRRSLMMMGEQYDTPQARLLVVLTTEHESDRRGYVRQVRGPAIMPAQIEPPTMDDTWSRMVPRERELLRAACGRLGTSQPSGAGLLEAALDRLGVTGIFAASAVACRLVYWHKTGVAIPQPDTPESWIRRLSMYYKTYYNSSLGDAKSDALVTVWGEMKRAGHDPVEALA